MIEGQKYLVISDHEEIIEHKLFTFKEAKEFAIKVAEHSGKQIFIFEYRYDTEEE